MYLSDSTLHSAIDGISRTLGIYVEVEGAEYAPASIIRLEWELHHRGDTFKSN